MAQGTTLLSYEMTWQLKLFDLMTASEQMNNVVMGCVYGEALYKFLRIENQLPTKKTPFKQGVNEELRTWNRYYADLLMGIVGRVGANIDDVRRKYNKDGDVPHYKKKDGPT